nr:AHS beta [Viridiscus sp. 3 JF-2023a]
MALRFAALLLLVAASVASAQRFSKHETIRALPESCQQGGNDWSSSSFGSSSNSRSGRYNGGDVSTFGPCKLLPPVYEQEGYEFCLKCKAGEKNGVTAEDLAQSIRQVVDRKLKRNSQFSRQAKLNLIFDGVKQPIDLTRVLANTPEVLEKIDDVFFFFPNGQIGRIEFEHGQPDELERITCRPPCRGGPRNAQQQGQSSYQRNQYNNNEDEDQDEQQQTYTSSSSRYFGSQNKNKKYPYSYGETSTPSYGSSRSSSSRHGGDDYYGSQSQSTSYSRNAGRYGDNKRRSSSAHQQEEEDDK